MDKGFRARVYIRPDEERENALDIARVLGLDDDLVCSELGKRQQKGYPLDIEYKGEVIDFMKKIDKRSPYITEINITQKPVLMLKKSYKESGIRFKKSYISFPKKDKTISLEGKDYSDIIFIYERLMESGTSYPGLVKLHYLDGDNKEYVFNIRRSSTREPIQKIIRDMINIKTYKKNPEPEGKKYANKNITKPKKAKKKKKTGRKRK